MNELIPSVNLQRPVLEVAPTQRVAENFVRQAPQMLATGPQTSPAVKTESPRATTPSSYIKEYDRHGDIEKEEEPVGERLFFKV